MKVIALSLAFYLFMGSLFPRTDFSQLPKFVFAIQHLYEHLQEEQTSGEVKSLREFAVKHFFNPQQHAPGHEQEHSQLPYQSINPISAFTLSIAAFLPKLNFNIITSSIIFQNLSISKIDFFGSIFRPPISF